jgi:predicted dehydrogenase
MKKTKIAVIGAGFVSQVAHLPSLSGNKNIKIVALCDFDKDLLKKVSKKYDINSTYSSYKEMIENEKIDGVVLTVNRTATAKIAKFILSKKIPLLSEKPAALSFKEAKALSDFSYKKKTKYVLGYMKRNDNGIIYIKKNLEKFKLGKLSSVYYESFLGDSYNNPFEYFKHKQKNYIKFNTLNKKFKDKKSLFIKYLNTNCHCINLLRYLFGELKIINKKFNKNAEGFVIFENKQKAKIIFNNQFTKAKSWKEKIFLNYQFGKVVINLPTPLHKNTSARITIENYKNGHQIKPWIKTGWSFRNQINEFVNYINGKKKNNSLSDSKDGVNDIRIIENLFNI